MKTLFDVQISYVKPDTNDRVGSFIATTHTAPDDNGFSHQIENLEEAKGSMLYYVNYYTRLGYEISDLAILEVCEECAGTGQVEKTFKRAPRKMVRCPACRGKNSSITHL